MTDQFSPKDIEDTAPLEKIGILATRDLEGLPHLTFINSLRAAGPALVTLGQFIRGNSKYYVQEHPKAAFFILSPVQKCFWTGKMVWTGKKDKGPELAFYKSQPLQRYNAYFPIHRVHYFDLVSTTPATRLPVVRMAAGILAAKLLGGVTPKTPGPQALTPYGKDLLSSPLTLKFFSVVGEDGFPVLIPLVPCTAPGKSILVFPARALKGLALAPGTPVAVFCLKTSMESILVRGEYSGNLRILGMNAGMIHIDWVYNSMPPNAGRIYPPEPLEPVTVFD